MSYTIVKTADKKYNLVQSAQRGSQGAKGDTGDGSPKDVYATLAKLQADISGGNIYTYVCTGNVAEIDTLNVTGAPTASGNLTVTLDGVAKTVAVVAGTAEVASLTISAACTTAGNATVTLNGVATTIALTTAMNTAALVATAIRGTTFTGYTTSGSDATVTFTANAVGAKTDAAYSAGSTGATGTMTTTTQGVDADTSTTVTTKIRATAFTGWTISGSGTSIIYTSTATGARVAPIFSGGTTGVTATFTVTEPGADNDGYLYSWSGSEWKPRVLYQATGTADDSVTGNKVVWNAITKEHTNFNPVTGTQSTNLFDRYSGTTGYYLLSNDSLGANSGYTLSDYMPVKPITVYSVKYPERTCFYDKHKKFISYLLDNAATFTTPAGAYYARISVINTNLAAQQINEGSSLLTYAKGGNILDAKRILDWSMDLTKLKYPVASVLHDRVLTLDLKAGTLTVAACMAVTDVTPFSISAQTAFDVSTAIASTSTLQACYYNPVTSSVGYAIYTNVPSGCYILFYRFGIRIIAPRVGAVVMKDADGYEIRQNPVVPSPQITLTAPLTIDYINNLVTIPSFYVTRDYASWKLVQASDYSLTSFQFSITNGVLTGIALNINTLYGTTTDPFETFDQGKFYGYLSNIMDKVLIFSSINYNVTTVFPYTTIQAAATVVFDETINRPILPVDMYFVNETELPIYKENLISNKDTSVDAMVINVDSLNNLDVDYIEKKAMLSASDLQSSFKLGLRFDDNPDYRYYSSIAKHAVTSASGSGKTVNYLAIGDSITALGTATATKVKALEYGVTVTPLGTYKPLADWIEARGGWSFANYIGKNNYLESQTITPSLSGTTTTRFENPFLKLATTDDKTNHPDWCFRNTGSASELSYTTDTDKTGDFYIFDLTAYLANHSIATPDVITIALSTNDIWQTTYDSDGMADCQLGLAIMIEQIKTTLPNVKLGIIPNPGCANSANGKKVWLNNFSKWIEICQDAVKTYQSTYSNLYIIPIWCHINQDWNYVFASTVDFDTVNHAQKSQITTDIVHFTSTATGLREYGTALAAWMMNVI